MWSPCIPWAHWSHMAGHILNVISICPLGTLYSHVWVHFECIWSLPTGHIVITYWLDSQCIQHVPTDYWGPCPQCQVVQPLAEKGGSLVIPWCGKVRFHENIDGPLVSQVWFPPVIDEVAYRQHGNCLSAPPVGSLFFDYPNDFFHSSFYGLITHMTLDAPMFPFVHYASFIYQDISIMLRWLRNDPFVFVMDFPTTRRCLCSFISRSHIPLVSTFYTTTIRAIVA